MYDLVVLAVAVAYLLRDGIEWDFQASTARRSLPPLCLF
jgi:hypothetical protein